MNARDLVVRPIDQALARRTIERLHYSGTTVRNSSVHLGVYAGASLEGAIQLGPPLDREKVLPLVRGSEWDSMLELNRLAFSDALPPNAESRALGVVFRLLRKHRPSLRWVLSFADATQCGDGTIYRASGFVLTAIKRSENIARIPGVGVIHKMTLESGPARKRADLGGRSYFEITGGRYDFRGFVAALGGEVLPGYQFRYLRFVDPAWADRLAVPVIPFRDIPPEARMLRGQRVGSMGGPGHQPADGGSSPTPTLQPQAGDG